MNKKKLPYTTAELMICRAAKELRDREIAFIGTGLPMIAAMLAKRTHAPNLVIIFEAGTIDSKLVHLPGSVGDPRCVCSSTTCSGLFDVFGTILQRGRVDVGFLGGAQCDMYGNLNSTAIGNYWKPKVRLPGSGGAGDIAALAKRTVIIMKHEKRRFPLKVDYLTSVGWVDGPEGRSKVGLTRGGPVTVVTDLCVMKFDEKTKRMYVAEIHPGVSREQIQAETGFPLDFSKAKTTPEPTEEEIRLIREKIDPERVILHRLSKLK